MWKARDLSGERFGKLTVISRAENTKDGKAQWLCLCECGGADVKSAANLLRGNTISCGCYSRVKDIQGRRYGKLTAMSYIGNDKTGRALWRCKCDCGAECILNSHHLISGNTTSCGCKTTKHNMTNTRLFKIWSGIKERCLNSSSKDYENYGGRGIGVCQEWQSDFLPFYLWAIKNGYQESLTIDRIDNSKGYAPDNCRWATPKVQASNRRTNRRLEYQGKLDTISGWSNATGIGASTIQYRLSREWPIDLVLGPKQEK